MLAMFPKISIPLFVLVILFFPFSSIGQVCPTPTSGSFSFNNQANFDAYFGANPTCTTINGDFVLTGNITNVSAASNITAIGGDLYIQCNNLISLSPFSNLTSIGEDLILLDNYQIDNLTGLDNVSAVSGTVIIVNNNSLGDCAVSTTFCDAVASKIPGQTLRLFFNQPGVLECMVGEGFNGLATACTLLPVSFTAFEVRISQDGKGSTLHWRTSTETENVGFEIQRSQDGKTWHRIGFVDGVGTTSEEQSYYFDDKLTVNCKYYYRLKQIDVDGAYAFSPIQALTIKSSIDVNVYPNPVSGDVFTVEWSKNKEEKGTLRIFSTTGQLLQEQHLFTNPQTVFIATLPKGVYTLEVANATKHYRQRLVVN